MKRQLSNHSVTFAAATKILEEEKPVSSSSTVAHGEGEEESVFSVADDILKKHLPESVNMLASRHTDISKIIQQLEQDYITAQRTSTTSFSPKRSSLSPSIQNPAPSSSSAFLGSSTSPVSIPAQKTPAMVIQEAQQALLLTSQTILQDMDRVSKDIIELTQVQEMAMESVACDVHYLATKLSNIQRHHYDECLTSDMTMLSSYQQKKRQNLSH
jgi:hypothetical protein